MTDLDVAVIGGGIAGLAAAHELTRAGREVRVFEAADHVGGRMATRRVSGFVVDSGAEQISTHGYPHTWELLRRLGLDTVPKIGRQLGVWRGGRVRRGLAHPLGLVTGAGLSVRARADFLRASRANGVDTERPEASPLGTATVAEFAAPCHRDVLEYLCQPVVSGFFGWQPERSAAAPFLGLLGAIGPSTAWRAYDGGMDVLARALAARLDVTTSFPVREVVTGQGSARVSGDGTEFRARSVVLAVPAPVARQVHVNAPAYERPFLDACTFTPMVKVHVMLDHRPESPVYVIAVPRSESPSVSVVLFDHLKHPDRAPDGRGLVTVIASPAMAPALLDLPDDEVVRVLADEAGRFVPGLRTGVTGSVVHRFRHGLPEATPRALALRGEFESRIGGVVDYAGDWVTLIPYSEAAVRSGRRAAARVLALNPSYTGTRRQLR
ncbi:oxygen-dependent protoporphyrinogen oxidase [Saccharothrix ecbatanensis]|uniref:Oxygen-dependent protoporphyrinogen oxidase n=1 Tax=Saccharothrix ecbatanensis TaxID=1105145 RepID=A0A7W9HHG2_9PSEU|nr:NAD(P)/FAD-dependent oxidoreductase [Saccharothrix ecbatanensis]MBB5802354.1 oxygen-dependent protoporphyrinogen oxidase [Saccharothrix ecbatanensis]